jgi:hypothetical protein
LDRDRGGLRGDRLVILIFLIFFILFIILVFFLVFFLFTVFVVGGWCCGIRWTSSKSACRLWLGVDVGRWTPTYRASHSMRRRRVRRCWG